ncbi:MAG: anaerobic ribonucleoside-triphosphate reductase [Abditibacteriota bacterium]|nr:anaerobic ribonucleoside-triphosphate reductase [Abditibacteriota bacterium]
MRVIKRNGTEVEFTAMRIYNAISKANNEVNDEDKLTPKQISNISNIVTAQCEKYDRAVSVEEIQELVETAIMKAAAFEVAKRYIRYRYIHNLRREKGNVDDMVMTLVEYNNEVVKQENSNKDPQIIPTQRDYIAGEVSKDISTRLLLPQDITTAHEEGIIHFHDADYFIQHSHNCDLVNLEDMLQNGTVISGTYIDTPKTFSTACNIATQIIAQVASCQYGGQSISLAHLAPFIDKTRQGLKEQNKELLDYMSEEEFNRFIEKGVRKDITKGVQTIQYQVVTLMTTNGQAPFITVYMNLNEAEGQTQKDLALAIEEVLNQRIQGVKNEDGVWITPAFPKLIYALDENNVHPGSEFYYLTELSAKCTAKRMVPDYISNKIERQLKQGDEYTCMGCRSFLTPYKDPETGKGKYYGRFNQGVVTLNLVDVALSSGKDEEKFWQILEDRLNLCYRALMLRHRRLEGTVSDVAPILWQHGALTRLKKGETIDKYLHNGYSTISLGYAGLYECVKYMTGYSHTDPKGHDFAIKVMERLNAACKGWKEKEKVDFSLYGTPIESTTYKFAKCLQKRFGIIEGVTDKNYITNSYHVHVTEPIDAFTKLKFESEFQALSPGGAISYVEVPNMTNNIPAVLSVISFIYDHIMYAELNTKSDYCSECHYDGEIKIVPDESGKLVWECPKCGNRDQNKMSVARRTCGYIGSNFWNQGRTQEIAERVLHL